MKFLFRVFAKVTGFLPFLIFIKPKIYHEDKKQKDNITFKGGCIVLMNHTRILDYFLLLLLFPFRSLHFIIGENIEKFGGKFVLWMSRMMGNIEIDRTNINMSYMEKCSSLLSKGKVVVIFPEGHFVKDDIIEPFKTSFVYLAYSNNVPLKVIYCNKKYALFKRTKVNISKKIFVQDCLSSYPNNKEATLVANKVRNKMLELKKQQKAYIKYHSYSLFSFRYFLLDFVKVISLLPTLIAFPFKKHYLTLDKRKVKIKGKFILAGDHPSFFDPFLMQFYFFSRRLHIITAEDLYIKLGKFMAWWFETAGNIKYRRISQQKVDILSFSEAKDVLSTNSVVGIFPEGHVDHDLGITHLDGGAVLLSLLSGAPILPYVHTSAIRPFRKQHLVIGDPIYLQDYYRKGTPINAELITKLNNILQNRLLDLKIYSRKFLNNEKR